MHCTVPVPKNDCSFLLLSPAKYILYLAGKTMNQRWKKDVLGQILKFFFWGGVWCHFALFNQLSYAAVPSQAHIHRHPKENKSLIFEAIMKIKGPQTSAVYLIHLKTSNGKSVDWESKFLPQSIIAT